MPRRTILIIDPDEGSREVCSSLLEFNGYQVLTAADVEAGLFLARSARPAAIVSELLGGGGGGKGIVGALKSDARTRAIPLLVLSALAASDDHALAPLANALLPKPIHSRSFLRELQRLCRPTARGAPRARGAPPFH